MMKFAINACMLTATVLASLAATASAQSNLLTNGDFEADPEGTVAAGTDFINSTTITGWRVFGVGGATNSATVTAAAGRTGKGIVLARTSPAGVDAAFDKDAPALRAPIPAESRLYKLLVDARDGGPFGGTPEFYMQLQFPNPNFFGQATYDPGAAFETFALNARSDTNATLSARFDVRAPDRSVHFDNARVFDVTTGVNRMLNGGFENSASRLLHWSFFDQSAAGSATVSTDAKTGSQAALLGVTLDPLGDVGLDIDASRIFTVPGETLEFSFSAKTVQAPSDSTRLRADLVGFGPTGTAYPLTSQFLDPSSASYEDFSFTVSLPTEVEGEPVSIDSVNVQFRTWDLSTQFPSIGSYLIDDVSLLREAGALGGDFDFDGNVDGNDFLVWQRGGSPNPVSATDLAEWRANFGAGAAFPAVAAVPEPTTAALIGVFTIALAVTVRPSTHQPNGSV